MSDSMNEPTQRRSFVRRVVCASLLHADTYEEVEADRTAIWQATLIVSAASLSIGVGSFSNGGVSGIAWTAVVMFMSWILWACVSCAIGVGLLATPETESDPGELLRTIGFSASPGLLGILGLIPGANPWVLIVIVCWMMATLVVAIRQALDYCSTWRAILVCALTSPLAVIPLVGVLLMTGPWPV